MFELLWFLFQAGVISLSGVLAPGPVTAAAIALGTKLRHAGAMMAVGHAIIEFPLMILILGGIGVLFESAVAKSIIGFVGGIFLLWMGIDMLRNLRVNSLPAAVNIRSPVMAGIILSISNPYFLLWWATVGLAMAKDARKLGILAFALFTIVHWICDLFWLEALSLASFKGSSLLTPLGQRRVLEVCAGAVLFFGAMFIYKALW